MHTGHWETVSQITSVDRRCSPNFPCSRLPWAPMLKKFFSMPGDTLTSDQNSEEKLFNINANVRDKFSIKVSLYASNSGVAKIEIVQCGRRDLTWSPGSFPRLIRPMAQAHWTQASNGTDNHPSFPRMIRLKDLSYMKVIHKLSSNRHPLLLCFSGLGNGWSSLNLCILTGKMSAHHSQNTASWQRSYMCLQINHPWGIVFPNHNDKKAKVPSPQWRLHVLSSGNSKCRNRLYLLSLLVLGLKQLWGPIPAATHVHGIINLLFMADAVLFDFITHRAAHQLLLSFYGLASVLLLPLL